MEELERQDIQGILLSSYSHLYWAFYVLLQVQEPGAARRGLSAIIDKVTTAQGKEDEASVNIALTQTGLTKLGLDPAALASFPIAFQEGMSSQHRSRILGDTGKSAPAAWKWGGQDKSVDILLMLFAPDQPAVEEQLQKARRLFPANGVIEIETLAAQRYPDNKEHFGFADGIGQPVIEGSGRLKRQLERTGHATEVKAGEFILGYVNEYDVPSDSPMVDPAKDPRQVLPESAAGGPRDLGRNGTYLVFRQMTQNVAGFWQFLDEATRHSDGQSDPKARDWLGAKFVGRWKSGAPLVETPDADCPKLGNDNDFGYAQSDPHGFACPFGAHIRRANPRDCLGDDPKEALSRARRHRLLRRGRAYGPRAADPLVDDGQERGLHFICLNSDIERQFEFVQQTWINNPVFDRLSGEVDPLVGDPEKGNRFLTIQSDPIRSRVHNLRAFSTIKGGAYFFLPGIRALRYLSSLES